MRSYQGSFFDRTIDGWRFRMVFPHITCPRCKRTSWHPEDVRQGYCGNCHQFHEFMPESPKYQLRLTRCRWCRARVFEGRGHFAGCVAGDRDEEGRMLPLPGAELVTAAVPLVAPYRPITDLFPKRRKQPRAGIFTSGDPTLSSQLHEFRRGHREEDCPLIPEAEPYRKRTGGSGGRWLWGRERSD